LFNLDKLDQRIERQKQKNQDILALFSALISEMAHYTKESGTFHGAKWHFT